MMDVCLLGVGGTIPLPGRALSALLISCAGRTLLIDCGEGTQLQLRRAHRSLKAADLILITHLHADHIAGLPGLLLSMGRDGRREEVGIVGPIGLQNALHAMLTIVPQLPFELRCIELEGDTHTLWLGKLRIEAFRALHTLPCYGYAVNLDRLPRFDAERARALGIPQSLWGQLQRGEAVCCSGSSYAPSQVLGCARKGLKLCYVTDTRPTDSIRHGASQADLLICEGMYSDIDKQDKALANAHMMVQEAAMIAADARVRELWLTHYSPSLKDPREAESAARELFANSFAGEELLCRTLRFQEDERAK